MFCSCLVSTLSPSNYPKLDTPPPTDSSEVQQWIQQVQASGIEIPNIPPTVPGGCPANVNQASNSSVCWWTCGGCTRESDVTTCPQKYSWGLTYDDGPAPYTPDLLNYLDQVDLKATFFVVGSRAISFPPLLQKEYLDGHQIGVHTWSHTALTTQTTEEIIAELGWTKKVIKDVLGVTPTTMRPPYGDIESVFFSLNHFSSSGLTGLMVNSTQRPCARHLQGHGPHPDYMDTPLRKRHFRY